MRSAQAEDSLTLASSIRRWLRIRDGETLLDYRAGNGALVGALRRMGVQAWGVEESLDLGDIDPYAKQWMNKSLPDHSYAHILALDLVLSPSLLKQLSSRFWTSMLVSYFDSDPKPDPRPWIEVIEKIDPSMQVSACYNPPFASGKGELYLTCRKPQ